MQYLLTNSMMTLSDLNKRSGSTKVADEILSANSVRRVPYVGKEFIRNVGEAIANTPEPDTQKKINILNTMTSESAVFERTALGSKDNWKTMAALGTFSDAMKVPEGYTIPDGSDVIGGSGDRVSNEIYRMTMESLQNTDEVDPSIFNEYSSIAPNPYLSGDPYKSNNMLFSLFNLPWGKIVLYSSIDKTSIEFPVYPEELSDGAKANYDTMPNLLYQYEPWYVYTSSGPRSITYDFKFHRDMWSGNHLDGKANELVRFCKACCYPEYNGSAVLAPTVTLYINGETHISGIMTSVDDKWSGPIGLDGFYLVCDLSIQITEVAPDPLDYATMKNKSLIGGLSRLTATTSTNQSTTTRI